MTDQPRAIIQMESYATAELVLTFLFDAELALRKKRSGHGLFIRPTLFPKHCIAICNATRYEKEQTTL